MSDHPRDRYDLIPDAGAEAAFLAALDGGRLHHAWMLCGPEGLGKATFAYRVARRLLGAEPSQAHGPLGACPDDAVSQLVAAQAHPDLLVLERAIENGRHRKSISVDQARGLPEFFSMSPARAKHRVAIIDAADDLNVNAANALLKILEEPPERGVLLLVTHAPGRLLATLRSRCRRLAFRPWSLDRLAALVESATDPMGTARLAGGSPGAALALAAGEASELDGLARSWVTGGGDPAEELAVAGGFRGAEGPARFELLFDRLLAAVHARAVEENAAPWAELWTRLGDLAEQTAGLNLDRGEALSAALADVRRTARPA